MAIIIDFISRGIQTSVYYIKMSVFPHLEGINPFTLYNCSIFPPVTFITFVSFWSLDTLRSLRTCRSSWSYRTLWACRAIELPSLSSPFQVIRFSIRPVCCRLCCLCLCIGKLSGIVGIFRCFHRIFYSRPNLTDKPVDVLLCPLI